jgi:hypothetical protein
LIWPKVTCGTKFGDNHCRPLRAFMKRPRSTTKRERRYHNGNFNKNTKLPRTTYCTSGPCADRSAQNRDRHQCSVAYRAPKQKHEATRHALHSSPETTKAKLFLLHEHRFYFMLTVYVPLAQDEELDMSGHVSLPFCVRNLTPNGRRRSPSLRSPICTASSAGLDQILSSFVKEGIATLNFDEITGMRQARQSGSSNGYEDALMNLLTMSRRVK